MADNDFHTEQVSLGFGGFGKMSFGEAVPAAPQPAVGAGVGTPSKGGRGSGKPRPMTVPRAKHWRENRCRQAGGFEPEAADVGSSGRAKGSAGRPRRDVCTAVDELCQEFASIQEGDSAFFISVRAELQSEPPQHQAHA